MGYQTMDHAKWMESNNAAINRRSTGKKTRKILSEKLTEFQAKVIDIIGMVGGGIYNAAINRRSTGKKTRKILPEKLTEFQAKVIDIIGMVGGGIYNADICSSEKIVWEYGYNGMSLTWGRELATWDFDQLTRLVFLCHEARIRCQLEAVAPRTMRMSFWQRKATGDMAIRHPNLDEAVAAFKQYLPADHRIIYRGKDEEAA